MVDVDQVRLISTKLMIGKFYYLYAFENYSKIGIKRLEFTNFMLSTRTRQ
jgi:hypothetical protein